MRALCLRGGALVPMDLPLPAVGEGEVLVRVAAAGITQTELGWYPTAHTRDGQAREGAVPSHEFSGILNDTGEEVYGMNDWFADGALAEYCVTRAEWIAPKPKSLTHAEAATVPIGALTAWQGLFGRVDLHAGETVLIHGGAGAVGMFAVQLAHAAGARVITTVSARNIEFARSLGADTVIDYRASAFEEMVRDVDAVFDTVGGETLSKSWSVVKPQGRVVTIAADAEGTADARAKQAFLLVEARRAELIEIARRIDAGELRTFLDAELPFDRAADAFVESRARGKAAVRLKS